ncbi:amidase signature enzyme [Russula dissimulans]|nr:amidase signature enzyme [Russula dissimulans]
MEYTQHHRDIFIPGPLESLVTAPSRRNAKIKLPAYRMNIALTPSDKEIVGHDVASLVAKVQNGVLDPEDVLLAYSNKALDAHRKTNCLTEAGPLAGMPISLKDTVGVAGFASCIGYSSPSKLVPYQKDAAIVQLLRDAGAYPFVKTNVPITLLSFESFSDVWGRSTNPYSNRHTPGGSTGGEGALLAAGGSRLGIGTDVAGSVRIPAHYCGVYTIKPSSHRFPKSGGSTSVVGQEGVPATFWRAVVGMKPWEYDPSCAPMPWRTVNLPKKMRRALKTVTSLLEEDGHEIIIIDPPSPLRALQIGSQLMANGYVADCSPIRWCESNGPGVTAGLFALRLPRFLIRLYAWFHRHILRDATYASLVQGWHVKDSQEYYTLVGQREYYRAEWFDYWQLDFVLTVPNALPAIRHGDGRRLWKACGYTFLFNILDYSAGVMPITRVDCALDKPAVPFTLRNKIERDAYLSYDADDMHGLPVGVQIVGRRLEEEKVLEGMKLIEGLLKRKGIAYAHMHM